MHPSFVLFHTSVLNVCKIYIYVHKCYQKPNLSCGILINNRSMKTLCAVYNDDTTPGSFPYFSNQVIAIIWSIASPISLQDHTHHGALEKCMHLLNE